MMKMIALLCVTAALLAGCNTRERVAARHDEQCRTYGFAPGTENYGKCRIILGTEHDRLEMRRAENLSNVGMGLMQMSKPAPTRHTVCHGAGPTVTCVTH